MSTENLPVGSLREALPHLRRPFAAEAIKWKVQSAWGSGAVIVAYIDARLVVDRLNMVVADLWDDEYEMVAAGLLLCKLTVGGVTRKDLGTGQGQDEKVKAKAMYSDALKRTAVKFGIGVSVYALPQIRLNVGSKPNELRLAGAKGKERPVIDERTKAKLVEGYAEWLKLDKFGQPLDHGDIGDAQGDVDEDPGDAEPEVAGEPALTDDWADVQRSQARAAFDRLHQIAPRAMLQGDFEAQLTSAEHSHDLLDALVLRLEEKLAEHGEVLA
jgi:hypothetical protein